MCMGLEASTGGGASLGRGGRSAAPLTRRAKKAADASKEKPAAARKKKRARDADEEPSSPKRARDAELTRSARALTQTAQAVVVA